MRGTLEPLTTARQDDQHYHATLQAGSIADAGINPLTAGDQLDFFILAGDANRDRLVDTQDFNLVAANFGGGSKVFSQGDFNYSTNVDSVDFDVFLNQYGKRLDAPVAESVSGSSDSNSSPPLFSPLGVVKGSEWSDPETLV